MAIRRINFTGRKRIARRDVAITLGRTSAVPTFDAALDLSLYEFPADAEVVVEAGADWTLMRFPFGTIGQPAASMNGALSEMETPEGIRFSVKVLARAMRLG